MRFERTDQSDQPRGTEQRRARPASQHPILDLQRSAGNAAVTRLLRQTHTTTTASPEKGETTPPPQGDTNPAQGGQAPDVSALAASLGQAMIKHQLRTSRDSSNESVRGGRYVGTVGGIRYALYQIDDVLLPYEDARRIETLIREAREQDMPNPPKDEDLWQTVLTLVRQNHPSGEIVKMLELTAEKPTIGTWFGAWMAQAVQEIKTRTAEPGRKAETEAETAPQAKIPAEAQRVLQLNLGVQHHKATGQELSKPRLTRERLKRERALLAKRYDQHNQSSGASLLDGELFTALEEELAVLQALAASLQSLEEAGDLANLRAFDYEQVDGAIAKAYRAEMKIRVPLQEIAANQAEGEASEKRAKGPHGKADKPDDTSKKTLRKGEAGVWDPGFSESELAKWLDTQASKRTIKDSSAAHCARVIAQGGGTAVDSTFGGLGVVHESRGKKGGTDGCTVFFTVAPDGVTTVLGIGWHIDPISYKLDWQLPGWTGGSIWVNKNTIRLGEK